MPKRTKQPVKIALDDSPLGSLFTQQLIRLYRAHETLTFAYETAGTEEGQNLFRDELRALNRHFLTITGLRKIGEAKAFIEAIIAGTVRSGDTEDEWRKAVTMVAREMGANEAPIVKAIAGG